MKTKNKVAILVAIITIVIVPNLVLAVWWNPFTWFAKKQIEKPVISQIGTNSAGLNQIYTSQDIKKVDEVKKETPNTETKISKKNSPQSALISDFLKDPTLENFKIFCEKAKNLEGKKTKQVLSADKQSLINQKDSMFNDFKECSYFDNKTLTSTGKESQFANYNLIALDKNLLIELKDNDEDWLREAKILYNNRVNDLINKSKIKFVVFYNSSKKQEVLNPNDLLSLYLNRIEGDEKEIAKATSDNHINVFMGGIKDSQNRIKSIYKDINEFKTSDLLYE